MEQMEPIRANKRYSLFLLISRLELEREIYFIKPGLPTLPPTPTPPLANMNSP